MSGGHSDGAWDATPGHENVGERHDHSQGENSDTKIMIWVRSKVKGEQVIWIQDSPGPTQHESTPSRPSPMMPTTLIRRNRGSPASTMKRGTRTCAHRRRARVVCNPTKKGHCGFEALAWICGLLPTMKNIRKLRELTAMSIIEMYRNGGSVHGVYVREEIDLMGIGVLKYASLLRTSMWGGSLRPDGWSVKIRCELCYQNSYTGSVHW